MILTLRKYLAGSNQSCPSSILGDRQSTRGHAQPAELRNGAISYRPAWEILS
ncbi:uncharacterized protein CTRU02_201783 [Colletotrichum truncatum]|uniref:Uncharacterized protein n=1 Tax=Colletotrichum truncatum TaxID=5467 RepID=A0ACC3ZIE5_COLTU